MDESNKLFISQFNKYLDIVLIWCALYLKFDNILFLPIPIIAFSLAVILFMLCSYSFSIRICYCASCTTKARNLFIQYKYQPKPTIEEAYWESERRKGESIQQTKDRIYEIRKNHDVQKQKKSLEIKAIFPTIGEIAK